MQYEQKIILFAYKQFTLYKVLQLKVTYTENIIVSVANNEKL